MITAILVSAVLWCTFYGQAPPVALFALCLAAGAALWRAGGHAHGGPFLSVDVYAQYSRLNAVNPSLKLWTALILMALCISSKSPVVGIFLTVAMLYFIVFVGGLHLHDYIQMLSLPVSFLMVSGLALLFEVTTQKTGLISLPLFGFWLSVGKASQIRAALIMCHALGAVSCLYLLNLTTPMSGIIGAFRRARCPAVLISLMYLIYRYIFILLNMYHTMHDAAASRLGFVDYRTNIRTTASIYGSLLARSYKQAGTNFDAMESRCYDTEIRFLDRAKAITPAHAGVAIAVTAFTLCLSIWLR